MDRGKHTHTELNWDFRYIFLSLHVIYSAFNNLPDSSWLVSLHVAHPLLRRMSCTIVGVFRLKEGLLIIFRRKAVECFMQGEKQQQIMCFVAQGVLGFDNLVFKISEILWIDADIQRFFKYNSRIWNMCLSWTRSLFSSESEFWVFVLPFLFQKMQMSHRPVEWLAVMLLVVFTAVLCQQNERWDSCSHLIYYWYIYTWCKIVQ